MGTNMKDAVKQVLDELAEEDLAEALDFLEYLRWRREEADQSWIKTPEWKARIAEAKEDLARGRYQEFQEIEALLAELKRPADPS